MSKNAILFFRTRDFSKIVFLFLLWLGFLGPASFIFGSRKNQEQPKLHYEVQATLKLIQVYVTDKDGKPVTGLDKTDFRLLDNDKPQPLTDFEKHLITSSSGEVGAQARPAAPPTIMKETLNRKFFLVFDFAYTDLGGIQMAKRTALHFIDTQADPTDEISIISYSTGNGLFLYEYLSQDRNRIRDVIGKLGSKETLGRAGQLMEELKGMRFASVSRNSYRDALAAFETMTDSVERYEALDFIKALRNFAKALRYVPGYKYIVFFSEGMSAFGPGDTHIQIDKMLRELAASNSPVLAVNVTGLDSRKEALEFNVDHIPEFVNRTISDDVILREMARLSGGKYFGDTNDHAKIAEGIQSLTGSYYVLGYKIDEKWDGRYHGIKVEVRRPGCTVHYQKGYFNPKPFAKFTKLEKELHLIDLALADKPYFEDPYRFPLRALPSPMKGSSNLSLVAEIPAGIVKGVSKEKIELFALVFDEKQNIVSKQRTEVGPSDLSGEKILFYAITDLPPGRYEGRVVLRNLKTGNGAVARSSISIPERFEEGLHLYPPLILAPGKKGAYINGSPKEGEINKPPSLADLYAFDPEVWTPVAGELDKDTDRLLVLLPASIIRFDKSNMDLSAHLVDHASGERKTLALSLLAQRQDDDVIVYSLELRTGRPAPGIYSLYLFAEDSTTRQSLTYISCLLEVR